MTLEEFLSKYNLTEVFATEYFKQRPKELEKYANLPVKEALFKSLKNEYDKETSRNTNFSLVWGFTSQGKDFWNAVYNMEHVERNLAIHEIKKPEEVVHRFEEQLKQHGIIPVKPASPWEEV